jgi:hypothetical protein
MQWKVPIDDSDGEKLTCRRVREKHTKWNAKRLHNRRKKAALKKERIKISPFAEDADKPFVPFIENVIIDKDPDMVENEEVEFFPTDLHPFCTGTIIEENGFFFKEREMDGVKMDIGHPISKSKFRTLVKVNLGRRTSRWQ